MNQQHTERASETSNPNEERDRNGIDQLAHDIVEIGRAWASFGLTIASRSLTTSAQTIELAAGSLERLKRNFAPGNPEDAVESETVVDSAVVIDEPKQD